MQTGAGRNRWTRCSCEGLLKRHANDTREDDASWPKKNIVGRQELEVRVDKDHISFEVSPSVWRRVSVANKQTAKIGSLADVNESADAEGLRVFYYLVQDLKVRRTDVFEITDWAVLHFHTDHIALQN